MLTNNTKKIVSLPTIFFCSKAFFSVSASFTPSCSASSAIPPSGRSAHHTAARSEKFPTASARKTAERYHAQCASLHRKGGVRLVRSTVGLAGRSERPEQAEASRVAPRKQRGPEQAASRIRSMVLRTSCPGTCTWIACPPFVNRHGTLPPWPERRLMQACPVRACGELGAPARSR